jgi:hypothetical protein
MSGGLDFAWYYLPPKGRSKRDGFEWLLIPVYGVAQEIIKADFLAQLLRTCENESLPLLLEG